MANKVTPNFALGANCALESSTVLLNEIVKMKQTLKTGERPSKSSITAMFHRYQEERKPRMQAAFDASAFITRLQACDGNLKHFIMRCVFPVQGQAAYADKLADLCAGAPKLDFLPTKYDKPASFQWRDEVIRMATDQKVKSGIGNRTTQKLLMTELASLISLMLLFFNLFSRSANESVTAPKWLNTSSEIQY